MAALRATRRRASGGARRRTRARARPQQRLPRLPSLALLSAACLFLLLAAVHWLHLFRDSPSAGPHFVEYTAVAGDTPSTIGSLFVADPAEIARQAGMTEVGAALPSGAQLRIDASQLWRYVTSGPRAANEALVESSARRLGLDPALAVAVAWQESRLDQAARSSTGAVGIMQVEPDTGRLAARDLGRSLDITIAEDNVQAGIFWLHALLDTYSGDRSSGLAAYYEGPGNLARLGYLAGTNAYVSHGLQLRAALLAADPRLAS
jgi:hypothetical protein